MTATLHDEIKNVGEKVDRHNKDSREFYGDMRIGMTSIREEIIGIKNEIRGIQKENMQLAWKVQEFEKKYNIQEIKIQAFEKKFIYITSALVFMGFLILVLFSG